MLLGPVSAFGVTRRNRMGSGLGAAARATGMMRVHSDHAVARAPGALAESGSETDLRETAEAVVRAVVPGTSVRGPIATSRERHGLATVPERRGHMTSSVSSSILAGFNLPVPMTTRRSIPVSRGMATAAAVSQTRVAASLGRDRLEPLRTEARSPSVQGQPESETLTPGIAVGRGGERPASALVHRAAAAAPPGDERTRATEAIATHLSTGGGGEDSPSFRKESAERETGNRDVRRRVDADDDRRSAVRDRPSRGGEQGAELAVRTVNASPEVHRESVAADIAAAASGWASDVANDAPTAHDRVGRTPGESRPRAIDVPVVKVRPRHVQWKEHDSAVVRFVSRWPLGAKARELAFTSGLADMPLSVRPVFRRADSTGEEREPRAFAEATGTLAVSSPGDREVGHGESGRGSGVRVRARGSLRGWQPLHHGGSSSTRVGRPGESVLRAARAQAGPHSFVGSGHDAPTSANGRRIVPAESMAIRTAFPASPSSEESSPWKEHDSAVVRFVSRWPLGAKDRELAFTSGLADMPLSVRPVFRRADSTGEKREPRAFAEATGTLAVSSPGDREVGHVESGRGSGVRVRARGSLRGWQPLHHGGSSSTRVGRPGESVLRAARAQAGPHSFVGSGQDAPTSANGRRIVPAESMAIRTGFPASPSSEEGSSPWSSVAAIVSSRDMPMPSPTTELTPVLASVRPMEPSDPGMVRRSANGPARGQPNGRATLRGMWYGVPLGRLPVTGDEFGLVRVAPRRRITITSPGLLRWPEWSTLGQQRGPLAMAQGTCPLAAPPVAADEGDAASLAPSGLMRRSDVSARVQQHAEPPALREASYEFSLGTALPVARDTARPVAIRRTAESSILRVSRDTSSTPGRPVPLDAAAEIRDVEAPTAAPNAPVDLDELVEKAWQTLMRRLTVEQERRGYTRWP